MTIRHHLNDDLLIGYASGNLSEGWSLAVATHLAMCSACRKNLAVAEAAGGVLLEAIEPVGGDERSWEALKSRLLSEPTPPIKPKVQPPSALIPEPLRSYLGADLADLKWRRVGTAHQILIKTEDRETQVRLLRIPAGKPVPEHSHGGRELTVVLTGAFHDEIDQFGPGDIEDADGSLTHQPVANAEADCICLAVTDAPLKFTSRLVRLVQPFLGI
ncbi:ChrR family anti-sigma-E factor [Devosia rhizoryzae]|uniref:Cupin domain-containing protein n=1 Tax=Devosia rhizoryzae TaxID=2774137 RepID=A0ABX7C3G4_9HYPH|nr:ChrR family anti-sigma-E factor [Devosia rhizoryzae]QQR38780.1 cupin domain-containing protein [Devosia rhizoryzae]